MLIALNVTLACPPPNLSNIVPGTLTAREYGDLLYAQSLRAGFP